MPTPPREAPLASNSAQGLLRKAGARLPRFIASRWTLAVVCALALALRMAVALVFPGYEHADEIYQALEQAHRLAFGIGIVPWEFAEGVRSYLLPGALAGVFRAAEGVWPGSYLLAARLALSLLSLATVCCAWGLLRRLAGPRAALIGAFLCAVWLELAYFGPKAHAEVVAGHVLLLGVYAVFPYFEGLRRGRLLCGGFLLGLAFCLRIQLAPALAALGIAIMAANGWRRALPVALGAAAALALAGLLDSLTLAYPFASIFGYFKVNVVEGMSRFFGRSPWSFLFAELARRWSVALALFAWFAVEGVRKARPLLLLLAMAAALFVAHSAVAHKEYRFIYPALPLLLIPVAAGIDRVTERLRPGSAAALAATLAGLAALSCMVAIGEFRPHFHYRYAETQAFAMIRQAPDACGVALHLPTWTDAPGYTVLHRDIPIYFAPEDAHVEQLRPAANYALSRTPLAGYTPIHQWTQDGDTLFLYWRGGGCTAQFPERRLLVVRR